MGLLPVPLLSRKGPMVQAGDCRTKWWLKEMGAGCGGTLQHATTAFSWGCEFALKSIGESQFMVRRKLALSHRLCVRLGVGPYQEFFLLFTTDKLVTYIWIKQKDE